MNRLRAGALAVLVLAASGYALDRSVAADGSATYYVDCRAGNDTSAGTDATTAWRTVARANKAGLLPGDALLFARGCTWDGERLDAKWNGAPDAPITISTYGTGAQPILRGGPNNTVKVTGSYLTIDDLGVVAAVRRTSECGNPLGTDYGINIMPSGHHNTISRSSITGFQAGVRIAAYAYENRVINNAIFGNNMVDDFHADPSVDLGAWGVLINGDNNEIAGNRFRDNRAVCANGTYKLQSNSVEIYGGRGNRIHHNRAFGDRVFSELGGPADRRAAGNYFAYNLFANDLENARFITTRGARNIQYGPVSGTTLVHNTVRLTGAGSEGVICGAGCGPDILAARSNIFWVDNRTVYSDAPFDEDDNLYWASNGQPVMQVPGGMASTSAIGDPLFWNVANSNYRLRWNSPARDEASRNTTASTSLPTADALAGILTVDLARASVPQNGVPDRGAFEFVGRVRVPVRTSAAVVPVADGDDLS